MTPSVMFVPDKQEAKFSGLVDTMQQLKKTFQHQQFLTETGSFLGIFLLRIAFPLIACLLTFVVVVLFVDKGFYPECLPLFSSFLLPFLRAPHFPLPFRLT